ncbi:hypothetical protein Anapl_07614 [Anas platyrhynchos]|uniref:Uncharacterized protein n=1 Tax=Anas platyrhynchos TaxID=8839 RepID=R0L761_ANAPL|nr:hypothetical protein Anapl_07614 [Anas platyrhynchos]
MEGRLLQQQKVVRSTPDMHTKLFPVLLPNKLYSVLTGTCPWKLNTPLRIVAPSCSAYGTASAQEVLKCQCQRGRAALPRSTVDEILAYLEGFVWGWRFSSSHAGGQVHWFVSGYLSQPWLSNKDVIETNRSVLPTFFSDAFNCIFFTHVLTEKWGTQNRDPNLSYTNVYAYLWRRAETGCAGSPAAIRSAQRCQNIPAPIVRPDAAAVLGTRTHGLHTCILYARHLLTRTHSEAQNGTSSAISKDKLLNDKPDCHFIGRRTHTAAALGTALGYGSSAPDLLRACIFKVHSDCRDSVPLIAEHQKWQPELHLLRCNTLRDVISDTQSLQAQAAAVLAAPKQERRQYNSANEKHELHIFITADDSACSNQRCSLQITPPRILPLLPLTCRSPISLPVSQDSGNQD